MSRMCCGEEGVVGERGVKPGFRVRTKWSLKKQEVRLGVQARGKKGDVLPHSMPTETHEIVHPVVALGHTGEDLGYPVLLLCFRHSLEAEVCRRVATACGILVACGGRRWW